MLDPNVVSWNHFRARAALAETIVGPPFAPQTFTLAQPNLKPTRPQQKAGGVDSLVGGSALPAAKTEPPAKPTRTTRRARAELSATADALNPKQAPTRARA